VSRRSIARRTRRLPDDLGAEHADAVDLGEPVARDHRGDANAVKVASAAKSRVTWASEGGKRREGRPWRTLPDGRGRPSMTGVNFPTPG
jgi:hypothetical protein